MRLVYILSSVTGRKTGNIGKGWIASGNRLSMNGKQRPPHRVCACHAPENILKNASISEGVEGVLVFEGLFAFFLFLGFALTAIFTMERDDDGDDTPPSM